jgi:hypothetical protein
MNGQIKRELADEGIVTQLVMVHRMLPKVKELLDEQVTEIKKLKALLKRSLPVSYVEDGNGGKHPVLCPDETLFDEIEEAIK